MISEGLIVIIIFIIIMLIGAIGGGIIERGAKNCAIKRLEAFVDILQGKKQC